jgi:uncharacterized protein YdaU (DUF1376 family)
MSSIHRLKPEHLAALKNGRAIPFLIDHRDLVCPGFTLSVIGTIDDQKFWGVFLADDEPDAELVDVELLTRLMLEPHPITSDSADAQAVHSLWSRWDTGMRQSYLDFFSLMGGLILRERLMSTLDAIPAPSDKKASPSTKKAKPKSAKSGKSSKTKAGAKPEAKKRKQPSDKGARS